MVTESFRRFIDRPATPWERYRLQGLWLVLDLTLLLAVAELVAWLIERELGPLQWTVILLMAAVRLWVFVRVGMYRAVLRYSGIHSLLTVCGAVCAGTAVAVLVTYFTRNPNTGGLGRLFLVPEALLAMVVCGGTRLLARLLLERIDAGPGKRTLIYGAGQLGELVLRQLRSELGFTLLGFIDDDPQRQGALIGGKPVLGRLDDLGVLIARHKPELVVVAINELSPERLRATFNTCMAQGLVVRRASGVASAMGHRHVGLADIPIEDLLRRPRRNLDPAPVRAILSGATVLVTGAGGSIGSELCRQAAAMGAAKLVLVEHGEFNCYRIEGELRKLFPELEVAPVLDDLGDRARLEKLFARWKPAVVFHAAAYKHVPLVEVNPCAGVANNLGGFRNLLAACDAAGVGRLVMISTDKAVHPTNVMGASKRACELLLRNAPQAGTHRCAVRFGNVLGSSGSVVPRFLEQIAKGGPVTVTHPEMTRYFMLIPEAVELVLQAGALADRGEIFILDMGQPVRIADLARQLILLSGRQPEREVPIVFTGLRPGEKLYEELLYDPAQARTSIKDITIGVNPPRDWGRLEAEIDHLLEVCQRRDRAAFIAALQAVVPEWIPSAEMKKGLGE
jgi:FlaA1/EpsC-like NDP-sugar epimerase